MTAQGRNGLQVVILAAGRGARIGRPYPKALVPLVDGRTILQRQLDLVDAVFGPATPVFIVVGFHAHLVREAATGRAAFGYNEAFENTNTACSLLRALDATSTDGAGVLWLNGDVVFDEELLPHLSSSLGADEGIVAVARRAVGDEEVKYRLDDAGYVRQISKVIAESPGEAVGINYVPRARRNEFSRHLRRCAPEDYFERAIETSVMAGLRFRAVDVTAFGCVEVDFEADLPAANNVVRRAGMPFVAT